MTPRTDKRTIRWAAGAALAFALAACSGGGSGGTGGDFLVLRTTPPNNGKLFLNEAIRIDFSSAVDITSADLNTVAFQVFDQNGDPLTERPAGTFSLSASAGDADVGRQLVFTPRFPTNSTYDDGGFRPGRTYVVQLVGGDRRNNTVLRDANGRGLAQAVSFTFQTADGTTPSQLFSDTRAGGPRVTAVQVTPRDNDGVALNKLGREPVEVRLSFDQPLNPAADNVPVAVSADPLVRVSADRGRISLEYVDPAAPSPPTWFPATVEIESNTREGSTVVLRPIGILPNNALISVLVESSVEDMSGESNVQNAAYDQIVATFSTRQDFAPQYDALVEEFGADTAMDLEAAFLEPTANLSAGKLTASFEFEGGESRLTYRPAQREVILDTDFTLITPENGPPINVAGGVFNFARVEIPEGVTVRGTGTRPMTWLVTGDFIVNGILNVDGSDGARVDTLNSANFPTPGGVGRCGGGNGGRGSPSATQRDLVGEAGNGPNQKASEGGQPGRLSCLAGCNRGSAGGGGSFSTQGDPYYPPPAQANRPFIASGEGGAGCVSANPTLAGGAPGPRGFTDTRNDNDFWGSGVNVFRSIRVRGELLTTRGGSGGGGGGDRSTTGCSVTDANFANDPKGGGGGAGGGIIIVKCLGTIRIGPRGLISANGGNGGGGEAAGGNTDAGCGGAGSGGMVVLMAGQGVEIFAHGSGAGFPLTGGTSYREQNYSFAVTADGGSGTQGEYAGNRIDGKYPPQTFPARPIGGFGGMGLVQIHVPPGDDQADATGNRLDDNIRFVYLDGAGVKQEVPPARKVQLLGWRGWLEPNGTRFNDLGVAITLLEGEGDIRPSPILLPSPFAPTSRGRSRWMELGAAVRDRLDNNPAPGVARVVVTPAGSEPKPDFGDPALGFGGTSNAANNAGYATFDSQGKLSFPTVSIGGNTSFALAGLSTSATLDGAAAYLAELVTGASLGTVADRYVGYRLGFLDGNGANLGDFRILSHNERFVFLAPDAAAPSGAVSCRVLAKFFDVSTDGAAGLGPTYAIDAQGNQAPVANLRIGFAFTTDPRAGFGAQRWPNGTVPTEERYEFDLLNPAFLAWLQTNHPKYVQWDVLFNTTYHPSNPGNSSGQSLSATTPRPAIEFLALPYRF